MAELFRNIFLKSFTQTSALKAVWENIDINVNAIKNFFTNFIHTPF